MTSIYSALTERCAFPNARLYPLFFAATLASAMLAMTSSPALAVVKYFDGFGDADVDNNGIPLLAADVDVSGGGLSTPGDTYAPTQDTSSGVGVDTIFPAGTLVQELTEVADASDTGLPWFQARGFDSTFHDKPSRRIIDDTTANLPETNPAIGFSHPNLPTQFSAAINSGPALAIEQKGRGSAFTAFFDDDYSDGNQGRVSLGPEVGDQVKVSLDFRGWMSAPNYNSSSVDHIPRFSDIRFGLYQDTDNQLGMTNPTAGVGGTPAVWGHEGGRFRGDDPSNPGPGAIGDTGWLARIKFGDPDFDPPYLDAVSPNGSEARIYEEVNVQNFLEGQDLDTVKAANPVTDTFVNLDYRKVYNLSLTLERFDDPATPGTEGDTILATLEVFDYATSTTYTLSDYEDVGIPGTNDPDGGIESDSWDYFGMKANGSTSEDEFDYLIDNFKLELFGSNAPNADADGDGDVDGNDFLKIQREDPSLIPFWQDQFGSVGQVAAVVGVPEPATSMLAGLAIMAVCTCRRRRR